MLKVGLGTSKLSHLNVSKLVLTFLGMDMMESPNEKTLAWCLGHKHELMSQHLQLCLKGILGLFRLLLNVLAQADTIILPLTQQAMHKLDVNPTHVQILFQTALN
jgi:hypothetical protein